MVGSMIFTPKWVDAEICFFFAVICRFIKAVKVQVEWLTGRTVHRCVLTVLKVRVRTCFFFRNSGTRK